MIANAILDSLLESDVDEPQRVEAIVNRLLEVDVDDPSMIMRSHPHFRFVHSSYEGEQVWIASEHDKTLRGRGSDWPQNIGNVIEGPERRWYIVSARGINNRDYNWGVGPKSQNYDSKEQAALAIWTRQHERRGDVPDMKRR